MSPDKTNQPRWRRGARDRRASRRNHGKEHELDQQAEDDRAVPELEQLHVGFQVSFDPADLSRKPRVDIGDLSRKPRVEVRNLGPHLGEAGLELVGRDVVTLLGGHSDRVRDGVCLGRREVGRGQRPGDSKCVEHRANPPTTPSEASPNARAAGAAPAPRWRGPAQGGGVRYRLPRSLLSCRGPFLSGAERPEEPAAKVASTRRGWNRKAAPVR